MRFLLFFLIVLVVFGIPVYLFLRSSKKQYYEREASAWKGKLVNKQHSDEWEDLEGHRVSESNTLIFKTNDGRKVEINVYPDVYAEWEIGDSAEKVTGELLPRKIS